MAKKEQKSEQKKKHSLKFPFIVLFIGILVVGASIVALKFFGKDLKVINQSSIEESSALLVVSTSQLTVTRDGQSANVESGSYPLFPGDNVKSNEAGTGYVVFSDNSTLSLDVNSEITIDEAKEEEDSFIVKVTQLAGRTWSRVENLFGKKTEYSVETPNTIAAVRGTIFGCDVVSATESTCYAIEHDVSLKLKNLESEENEIILDEGNQFTNKDEEVKDKNLEEIKNKIEVLGDKIGEWKELNECLTQKTEELLSGDEQRVLDFLKENYEKLVCGDETETTEDTEEPTDTPVVIPAATVGAISFSQQGNKLVCTWAATDATSYSVSISKIAGAKSLPWVTRTVRTYSRSDIATGFNYYCNVIAKGDGGNSPVKVSKPVYFDISTGSIDGTDPDVAGYYYGQSAATGKFYNLSFSNLRLKYSIKRSDNSKYLKAGTGWQDGLYWNVVAPVQMAADSYSYSGNPGGVDGPFNVTINWVLFNNVNGKVLDSSSVSVSNNW